MKPHLNATVGTCRGPSSLTTYSADADCCGRWTQRVDRRCLPRARAGLQTILVEARSEVGGCASTVTDLGARFNICNCDHSMIRAMPLLDELDLKDHGLTYLESEISAVHSSYEQ